MTENLFFSLKVRWELNLTATVMETTVLKPAAVHVNLAGGEWTAPNPTVPVTVRIGAAALTESVSASRATQEKTALLRSALWTAEHTAGVWAVFASAWMVSSVKTALKPSASTTAAAAVKMESACVMNPGTALTALNLSARKTAPTGDAVWMAPATAMRDTLGRTVANASVPTSAMVMVSVWMAAACALLASAGKTALNSPASTIVMAEVRASMGCVSATQATKVKIAVS